MIGISGRGPTEPEAPPASSTLPLRTPAHVEGARSAFERKTGMSLDTEPRALGGPAHYAMGVFNC
jgi:hypothetical protein